MKDLEAMTKEELIKEVASLNKKLNQKKVKVKFQSIYINMIKKMLPEFALMVKDSTTPALIMNKNKIAGILMPLKN